MDAMKRHNNISKSAVSKLGESACNALMIPRQTSDEGKRILHYSYNLAWDAGLKEDSEGYQGLKGADTLIRNEREKRALEDEYLSEIFRRKSYSTLASKSHSSEGSEGNWRQSLTSRQLISNRFQTKQSLQETKDRFWRTFPQKSETNDNGASVKHPPRKIGVGETTNISLMSHKLRKKAVCDSTDNSHYQRQFLRVLNKRF